jgi:quercetin dioxygenase-like cupin family protein
VQLTRLTDAPGYDEQQFVARPLLDAAQCNVRLIRLSPGQALPPHTHDSSDLMLYVVEGDGEIGTPDGDVGFAAGALAHLTGEEQLRVTNTGTTGMTLLAFLAPPFPPTGG